MFFVAGHGFVMRMSIDVLADGNHGKLGGNAPYCTRVTTRGGAMVTRPENVTLQVFPLATMDFRPYLLCDVAAKQDGSPLEGGLEGQGRLVRIAGLHRCMRGQELDPGKAEINLIPRQRSPAKEFRARGTKLVERLSVLLIPGCSLSLLVLLAEPAVKDPLDFKRPHKRRETADVVLIRMGQDKEVDGADARIFQESD